VAFASDDRSGQSGAVEPPLEGQGVTGSDGRFTLEIQTKRLPANRRLTVSTTVTDLSRRSQQSTGTLLVTGGQFQISIETDRYMYRVNEPMIVTVTAVDYDQKVVCLCLQKLL
jgi:hypothetical protein